MGGGKTLLDYEKGIDNLGGFEVTSQKAEKDNSITRNSDGTYTLKSVGGSQGWGTDAVFGPKRDKIHNGIILCDVEIIRISNGLYTTKSPFNSRKIISTYQNVIGKTIVMPLSNNLNENYGIGLTSIDTNGCEVKVKRAWLIPYQEK